MIRYPAQYDDIFVAPEDLPLSWTVPITRNGLPIDLSSSTITAILTDNSVQVGELDLDMTTAISGTVKLTLTQDLYDAVGTYSSWRLNESPVFGRRVVQGRLVKRI